MGSGPGADRAGARPSAGWVGRGPTGVLDLDLDRRLYLLTTGLRWITVTLGFVWGLAKGSPSAQFVPVSLALVAWCLLTTLVRSRIEPPDARVRYGVLSGMLLTLIAASITGGLESPYVLTPMVPLMLAGYAWGRRQYVALSVLSLIVVTVVLVIQRADTASQRSAAQLGVILLLSGALGSFTRRLVTELQERHEAAVDQVARMATANELLVALHSVAQTLPASLDLGEVLDGMRIRLRSLLEFTALAVFVRDEATQEWRLELAEGCRLPQLVPTALLPIPLRRATEQVRPAVVADLVALGEDGCAPLARSGLYAPLRARGSVVGLLALEHHDEGRFGLADVDLLAGFAGPVALAVDNARWFARLRIFGAEAERARIARELHDQLAQSLAYVAFELERLADPAAAEDRTQSLGELREVVRGVVGELRETLFQLRANVSADEDLETVAGRFIERYVERTGIQVAWEARVERPLPFQVEQELWRVLQEALVNVERHAGASRANVRWQVGDGRALLEVRDDGRGFRPHADHGDHYGLLGMHERAESVGAHLTVDSEPGAGTRILVELDIPR